MAEDSCQNTHNLIIRNVRHRWLWSMQLNGSVEPVRNESSRRTTFVSACLCVCVSVCSAWNGCMIVLLVWSFFTDNWIVLRYKNVTSGPECFTSKLSSTLPRSEKFSQCKLCKPWTLVILFIICGFVPVQKWSKDQELSKLDDSLILPHAAFPMIRAKLSNCVFFWPSRLLDHGDCHLRKIIPSKEMPNSKVNEFHSYMQTAYLLNFR